MKNRIAFCLLPVFVLACNEKAPKVESGTVDQIRTQEFDRKTAIAEWHRDSVGCLGLRHDLLRRGIVKHLNIKNLTGKEIQELLGSPNEKKTIENSEPFNNQDVVMLDYYSEGDCQNRESSEVFVLSVFTVVVSATSDSVIRIGGVSR